MEPIKNILFSTTRQWNPGDEFILMGILNLMRSVDGNFNPVIFNRNPEIQRRNSNMCFNFQIDISRMRVKRLKSGSYDNSFKEKFLNERFIDLAVFAGTPEWGSPRLKIMYEYIQRYSIPVVYLGIGLGDSKFDVSQLNDTYRSVLKKAKLITVRDRLCAAVLSQFNPVFLPCPALLSASRDSEKNITQVKKVGLIYSSDKSIKYNKVDQKTHSFTMDLYRRFLEKYANQFDIEFICHYVDELPEICKDFDSVRYHYSYDASQYLGIYNKFDLVIGTRVHGMGIAASMGIPGIYIQHDVRADTCEGFCTEIIKADSAFEDIFKIFDLKLRQVSQINKEILEYKTKAFQKYQDLLRPILKAI